MDLSDINKVANRKRVSSDAEKLREEMSRESSKIIKLRVAQDTAYWELKEQLSGVEGKHERLQQNMVDVQMQYEELSARYQDELRLRPETLNKVAGTHRLCDALEQHAASVRASLSRAAADRDLIVAAYTGATARVQASHEQHARSADAARARAAADAERVRSSLEREQQSRREGEATREHLQACANELRADLQRERTIYEQRLEAQRRATEAAVEGQRRAAEALAESQRRAAEAAAEIQRRAAEAEAEIQRLTAEAAAERQRAAQHSADLQRQVQEGVAALHEAKASIAAAAEEVTHQTEAKQSVEAICADLEQKLASAAQRDEIRELELEALQNKNRELERKAEENAACALEARSEANAAIASRDTALAACDRALDTEADTDARLARCDAALRDEREAHAAAAKEAQAEYERQLEERAETIARLIHDVAAQAAARDRFEGMLRAATERENALQDKVREQEGQAKTVLMLTSEKERLEELTRGMQRTIDNMQQQAARREPPEHDDNAMCSPPRPPPAPTPAPTSATGARARDLGKGREPKARADEDLIWNFLSDSNSADPDALDPSAVNARFEALALSRGVAPPVRARAPAADGAPSRAPDDALSLSQVRKEQAVRGRIFFRNKRIEGKPRK